MSELLNRLTNALRSAGDRVKNETAADAGVLGLAAYLLEKADAVDPEALLAAVEGNPWGVLAIAALSGLVRQSVVCKRTHEVEKEIKAMGDESA